MEQAGWRRDEHLERLEEDFDLVVIGGGIVGAGVALDAAARGLSVSIVERDDWAAGTSSRSTKLLHGGVRYLPQLRFGLIREGLHEQKVLARTADYLFEPIDFVIPVYRDRGFADAPRWARHPRIFPWALRIGLWFYDRLGARHRTTRRVLDVEETRQLFPLLRTETLRHSVVYQDAQTDDARLTLMVVRTAVDHGAVAVNHTEAIQATPRGTGWDIEVRDTLEGRSRTIRTRVVVAATGAEPPPIDAATHHLPVVLSKGTHLITRQTDVGVTSSALVLPETDDGRVLFIVPWRRHAIVGTTDTEYSGDPQNPRATAEDVEYLQSHLQQYLEVGTFEPLSTWAGLRALAAAAGTPTASASRRHKVAEIAPGYLQVAGGKLTGYRVIAAGVTDRVATLLGDHRPSTTDRIHLVGSGVDDDLIAEATTRVVALGMPAECGRELVARYGTTSRALLGLATDEPHLAEPIASRWLGAEVAHAARHESAATIADFVLRRTRLAWFTADHAADALDDVGRILGAELGWSAMRLTDEVERARRELEAEGL